MPMTSLVYEASPYSVHERLLILPMIWRTAQTAHGQCGVGELTTKTDVEGHVRIVRMKIQTLKAHNIKMHSSTKHLTESMHDPTAGGMLLGAEWGTDRVHFGLVLDNEGVVFVESTPFDRIDGSGDGLKHHFLQFTVCIDHDHRLGSSSQMISSLQDLFNRIDLQVGYLPVEHTACSSVLFNRTDLWQCCGAQTRKTSYLYVREYCDSYLIMSYMPISFTMSP